MHLGIFARTFPRPSLEETLDAIADRGITHVQFNMSCAGLPTLPERLSEDLCIWIARSFRERGLIMAAISGTFNLCDPQPLRLAENLGRLGILAAACRWLDTRIITLCTGTRDPEDMWKGHPDNVRRATWDALVGAVRTAVKIADRHEVTLAFEPERNNVVNSVARARMLLDEIGSPWLKVIIDPANLMGADDGPRAAEVMDEAFDWLGPDIILAHAKNPPYSRFAEDWAAIRPHLEDRDPRWLGHQIAMRKMALRIEGPGRSPERGEELGFPAREPFQALHEFYDLFIRKLIDMHYAGSMVMHGLDEDLVAPVQGMIEGLIVRARGQG